MIKKVLIWLPAVVILTVGIYFIVTTSPSVRYWVDDLCSAALLKNVGFWQDQLSWWQSWTGRYSATFFISVFELIGPWIVRILPILLLALLIAGLYRFGWVLASLFIILTLFNAPNIIQSFYWQTGALNYLAPFIFLNLFLSFLVFPPSKNNILIPGFLLFIAGGFSEAYVLAQTVLLLFILLAIKIIFPRDKFRMKIILSGLLGSLLSLALVYLAPGNASRALTVTHPSSLLFVIKSTLLGTKWYLLRMLGIKDFAYSLLIILFSTYLIGKHYLLKTKEAVTLMILAILAAIFITMVVIGSGFYSIAIIPPERTLFIAVYMMFISILVFSFALSSLLRNVITTKRNEILTWAIIFLNIATSALLIKSVIMHWTNVRGEVQVYANSFDKVEPLLIQSTGKEQISIKNIKAVGDLDSFTDNNGWVAGCLAEYYKIKNIKIAP